MSATGDTMTIGALPSISCHQSESKALKSDNTPMRWCFVPACAGGGVGEVRGVEGVCAVVLSQAEVARVLAGTMQLIGQVLHGSGLRRLEGLRLALCRSSVFNERRNCLPLRLT